MDFNLDKLLNFPNATVDSCSIIDEVSYFQIRWLNEKIECPICGEKTTKLHQEHKSLIRDLSVFGREVYLKITHRRFYCHSCQHYVSEQLDFIDWRRHQTRRYQEYIYERVKVTNVLQVSREENLTENQVQSIFDLLGIPLSKKKWARPKRISIDEISLRKGHKDFVTVISDIDTGELLEVINSHKQDDIVKTLAELDLEVRLCVTEVSIDMWGGYVKVVEKIFPNAQIVYDRFHVMQHVNRELNLLRRMAGVTARGSKYLLLSNGVDLDVESQEKLEVILAQSPCLAIAYQLKEELRAIYETSKTLKSAKRKIKKWLIYAKLFYHQSAQMIDSHLAGICNYFISHTTSGVMEGINNKIKLIKRQAYGFTNFDNFRLRVLACFLDKQNLSL